MVHSGPCAAKTILLFLVFFRLICTTPCKIYYSVSADVLTRILCSVSFEENAGSVRNAQC